MKSIKHSLFILTLFFCYTIMADIIAPSVDSFESEVIFVDRYANNTIDGSGLIDGGDGVTGSEDDGHGTVAEDGWVTNSTISNGWISYNLGAVYDLTKILVWNYNEAGFPGHGMNEVIIEGAGVDKIFDISFSTTFSKGTGTEAIPCQVIDLSGFDDVQYIKLTATSNHGDNRTGLAEVRFEGEIKMNVETAINPNPTLNAADVEPNPTLSWDANDSENSATEFNIYVGVGEASYNYLVHTATVSRGAIERHSYTAPGNMVQLGGKYWWRVDKVTADGTVPGTVWKFQTRDETEVEKDTRMAWFREGKVFGAHVWGLYSGAQGVWPPVTGEKNSSWTYAEWMQFWMKLDTLEYKEALEPYLTGENFDAEQQAKLCKKAGFEMVYVMPRHHDGYAIWDTATTTILAPDGFKITNSPYNPQKRDYLKEITDALRAEGIRVGFYFSLGDWHHPDFPHSGEPWAHPTAGTNNPPGHVENWDNYVEYLHQQVTEIVDPSVGKDYGRFDVVYFDYSSNGINGEDWGATRLVHLVKKHNPDVIINNRLWNGLENPYGDFATPEAEVPGEGYDRDWEAIMSANEPPTWGYGRPDIFHWKTPKELVWDIVDVASKGGLIELSFSPMADGTLDQGQIDAYTGLGNWMEVNGESIKGTTENPVGIRPEWGALTSKKDENRLFFHVFDRPVDGNVFAFGLTGKASKAWVLNDHSQELMVTTAVNGINVFLPENMVDPVDTVIVLDYDFTDSVVKTTVHEVSSENVLGLSRDADNTVNLSGLSVSSNQTVHAQGEDGIVWTTVGNLGPGSDYAPFITYDLGIVKNIYRIREWGYNAAGFSQFGPDEVEIHTSQDGVDFSYVETVNFAQALGGDGYSGNEIYVNYENIRYIKLVIKTNHDGAVFDGSGNENGADGRALTGLSEISFETVLEEPAIGVELSQTGNNFVWSVNSEIGIEYFKIIDPATGEPIISFDVENCPYVYALPSNSQAWLVIVGTNGFSQTFIPSSDKVKVFCSLETGWNLISMPGKNADIAELKGKTSGIFWGWNGSAYEILSDPLAGEAVWVFSETNENTIIEAEKMAFDLNLRTGWNMVGPTENIPIPENAHTVYGWNGDYIELSSDNDVLLQGVGYWVFALTASDE